MMEFKQVKVKGVKADIGAQRIKLSFDLPLNGDNLVQAESLAEYLDKNMGTMNLQVMPYQQPFVGMDLGGGDTTRIVNSATGEILSESTEEK